MMNQSFSVLLTLWVSVLTGVATLTAQPDVIIDQYGTEYAPDLVKSD